jgi:hypothetical protein
MTLSAEHRWGEASCGRPRQEAGRADPDDARAEPACFGRRHGIGHGSSLAPVTRRSQARQLYEFLTSARRPVEAGDHWSHRCRRNRRPSDYKSKSLRPAGAAQTRSGCSGQRGRLLSAFLTCRVMAGGMTKRMTGLSHGSPPNHGDLRSGSVVGNSKGGAQLPLLSPDGRSAAPDNRIGCQGKRVPSGTAVEGRGRRETPAGVRASPRGDVPPSGRNHLHRVKPVARTEAIIDRQERQRSEVGARTPTRHLGVAGGGVASRFVWS